MDIFVYSDESGVFDVAHNKYFVFGGIILLGKASKEKCARKYAHVEKVLRNNKSVGVDYELKATRITNSEKSQLFRSLNNVYKFGVVINQKNLHKKIFEQKKTKQRYLDYAYKIALKKALKSLIDSGAIDVKDVNSLNVYVDEHTTATDGRYELRESIEQEFKLGVVNFQYGTYYPPIFPDIKVVNLDYCNSSSVRLVRAADIVSNRLFYMAVNEQIDSINRENFFITFLP